MLFDPPKGCNSFAGCAMGKQVRLGVTGIAATAAACVVMLGPSRAKAQAAPFTLQSVSAGSEHACGLTAAHTAYCWGRNADGELGNPAATSVCEETGDACATKPVRVAGGLAFSTISAGDHFTCAITTGGAAYCWGNNAYGQLGTGSQTSASRPVAVGIQGVTFQSISAGATHACAVTTAGAAYCWGSNAGGKLGDGGAPGGGHTVPVPVAGRIVFRTISAGYFHTCAIARDGRTYCWGRNELGEAGTSPRVQASSPRLVAGNLVSRQVVAASQFDYSCAVGADSTLKCWGANCYGQLGVDSTTEACGTPAMPCASTPAAIRASAPVTMVGAAYSHSCAVTATGGLLCWGENNQGQAGTGRLGERVAAPTPVAGSATWRYLSAGREFTCALTTDGAPQCWGRNGNGELGTGDTGPRNAPTPVVQP